MIEMLISGQDKVVRKEYPDSGPGPKYLLRGDEGKGFFGTVSSLEMAASSSLRDFLRFEALGASAGYIDSSSWLKFFYAGRVIFIPTRHLGVASYANLEAARATFGVNFPVKPSKLPVSGLSMYAENAVVGVGEKKGARVRLLSMSGTSDKVNSTATLSSLAGTELTDLWLGAATEAANWPNIFGIPKIAMTNGAEQFMNAQSWSSTTGGCVTIRDNSAQSSLYSQSLSAATQWRPVLEIVPADEMGSIAIPLIVTSITSDIGDAPPVMSFAVSETPLHLTGIHAIDGVEVASVAAIQSGSINPVTVVACGEVARSHSIVSEIISVPDNAVFATSLYSTNHTVVTATN